jgi:hypothetical protein
MIASQNSQCLVQDSYQALSKYKSEALLLKICYNISGLESQVSLLVLKEKVNKNNYYSV